MLKKRIGEISIRIRQIRTIAPALDRRPLKEEQRRRDSSQLVMPEEADAAKGLISTSSPIGRAIVGRNEGDEIQVTTPNGIRNFEIIKLITIHDEA